MTNTMAALRRHNNFPAWIMMMLALVMFLPLPILRVGFIDLQSVSVSMAGPEPMVTASRIIRRDFEGRYRVTVRASSGEWVCAATPPRWVEYSTAANATNPITKPLWWWIGSRAAYERCVADGMRGGDFHISTCHWALVGWLPIGPRCVESNIFRVE